MAASHSNNQSLDLSAAFDITSFPGLEALVKEFEKEGLPSPNTQSPPSKSENTPQPSAGSASPAPASTSQASNQASSQAASPQPPSPQPAEPLTAVARCSNAYNQAYKQAKEKKSSDYDCRKDAERAYINKIPGLHDPENIKDFIACVAYAMLIHIISPSEGTKILYAAQIATQASQSSQTRNNIANRNKFSPEK